MRSLFFNDVIRYAHNDVTHFVRNDVLAKARNDAMFAHCGEATHHLRKAQHHWAKPTSFAVGNIILPVRANIMSKKHSRGVLF